MQVLYWQLGLRDSGKLADGQKVQAMQSMQAIKSTPNV
jgi:hypothetical protein